MGSVRQAVLEFDAAVRVPWRPLLREGAPVRAGTPARAGAPGGPGVTAGPGPAVQRSGLPGSGPRVPGHLRPVPDRPADRAPRTAGPSAEPPRTRRDPARPGGRPPHSAPPRATRGRRTPPPPPVRLTPRGRRLVAVLVLTAGIGGAVLGREVLAPDPGLRLAGESSVVVERGDTVWSIADRVTGSDEDVRAVVAAIVALNDLEDSVVVPGQVLRVP